MPASSSGLHTYYLYWLTNTVETSALLVLNWHHGTQSLVGQTFPRGLHPVRHIKEQMLCIIFMALFHVVFKQYGSLTKSYHQILKPSAT